MAERYMTWIARHGSAGRDCAEVTVAMVQEFPELRRVRGHYVSLVPYPSSPGLPGHPHWWCVAPDGTVVDPTAAQFPDRGAGDYVEHAGPEPSGRCLDCGAYVYGGATFCSQDCERAAIALMRREVPRG